MDHPGDTLPARKAQIRPTLARAIEQIVHLGATISEAAEATGMRRESLSKALKKAHVQAHLRGVKQARLESQTFAAYGTIFDLATSAASEDVRLKAAKVVLELAGELGQNDRRDADHTPRTTIQIVVSHHGQQQQIAVSDRGVIEAAAFQLPSHSADEDA